MSNRVNDTQFSWTLPLAGLCCILFVALLVFAKQHQAEDRLKFNKEAIAKGHAEWVAQPDGSTVFRWKEVK